METELKNGCWNIRRGLIRRERDIKNLINQEKMEVLFLVEKDSVMVKAPEDFKVEGFTTIIQKRKEAKEKTRIAFLWEGHQILLALFFLCANYAQTIKTPTTIHRYTTHEPTHAMTHAWPSLLVVSDPNPVRTQPKHTWTT